MNKDEALQVIRSNFPIGGNQLCEALETLIPELKESEDERIRKSLIKSYTNQHPANFPTVDGFTREQILAWLEKQGENSIYNVPSREVILAIWELGNEWKELTNGCISTEYGTQLNYNKKHWHESEYFLKEKQGEQKPTCLLDNSYSNVKFPFKAKVKSTGKIVTIDGGQLSMNCKEWIKYQSDVEDGYMVYNPEDLELVCNIEQKPAWSDEDERICQCLIEDQGKALNDVKNDKYGHSEIISDLKEMYIERIDWLKSIKKRMKGE